jgi:nicotinamidase/pyrazinamidase
VKKEQERIIVVQRGDALSVTDVQYDFLPGGSLGVPDGDQVVPSLNRAIAIFQKKNLPVFFTRDWHPPDHSSFKEQGGPWPPHCVRKTEGAKFYAGLQVPKDAVIISKAVTRDSEQYSTLYGKDSKGKTENALLEAKGVSRLFIGGLATEYCVLHTVKDALGEGFEVYILTDGIRAVNVNPGDGEKALREMAAKGAKLITTDMLQ